MKKIKLLLVSLAVMGLFVACPPEPQTPPTPPTKPTIKPTDKYVKSGSYATITSKEKGEIYYQLVDGDGEATLTKDNYKEVGTKFNKGVAITKASTLYAIAVKDGLFSEVSKQAYKIPVPGEDSDVIRLHPMILPSGIKGYNIPAWTKAADAIKTDLPAVVTGFTTEESSYKELSGATNRTPELMAAVDEANANHSLDNRPVKNIIYVFTDGWGETGVVGSREHYKIQGQEEKGLFMDHLPYHAPGNHDSYKRPYGGSAEEKAVWKYDAANNDWNVKFYDETKNPQDEYECTDSTAGGSAINTGYTTYYNACAVDTHGTEVKSILELAREKGMLTGNVTNDYLTDATPATVGIHSPKRKDSNIINGRMFITSPDWIMGRGGFSDFLKSANPFGSFAGHEYSAAYDGMSKSMLQQWYEANTANGNLQKYAKALLKEYDGNTNVADNYDFKTWAKDRNMKNYSSIKVALEAFDADTTIRPYIPLGEDPANHYDYTPDAFNKKTGNYEVAPKIGYKIGYGEKGGVVFPNFAEMVASTLYALDKRAKAENRGFFAFIENTSSDGWGHAQRALDVLNETQITDEAIAIAAKYVLENPDTLMVVCADHETGGINFKQGWETEAVGNIYSTTNGHSRQPTPIYAFGASANVYFGDIPNFSMDEWTPDEKKAYAMGTIYPTPDKWASPSQEAQPTARPAAGDPYPKILRNRQVGIRIAQAMGYNKFGDLNGNGLLDPDTESDSVVDVDGSLIGTNRVKLHD